jgi:hypothetical protein
MIVVADIKVITAVAEESLVMVVNLVMENLVREVAQEVLGSAVTKTVRLACTMAVHLVVVQTSLAQVKNSVKKGLVRVVLALDRVKIGLQEANLGVNLVKNSQNPVKF